MTLFQELELVNTLRDYIGRLGVKSDWSDYMYYVWLPEVRDEHSLGVNYLIKMVNMNNIYS
jgi:hypothetical protein